MNYPTDLKNILKMIILRNHVSKSYKRICVVYLACFYLTCRRLHEKCVETKPRCTWIMLS